MAEKKSRPGWSPEARARTRPVAPFDCDLGKLMALAGDIVMVAARDMIWAKRHLEKLEREKRSGKYNAEFQMKMQVIQSEADYKKALEEWNWKRRKVMGERMELRKRYEEEGYSPHQAKAKANIKIRMPKKPVMKRVRHTITSYDEQYAQYDRIYTECKLFFLGTSYPILCSYPGEAAVREIEKKCEMR